MWHRLTYDKCFERWDTPFILVIIADGVIILHIMKEHQLNDSLHTTQFSSKWQLAAFYKTGGIKCKQTQNIKTSLNITENNTNFTRMHSERSAIIPYAMDRAEYNTCVINHRRPLTMLKSFPASRLYHLPQDTGTYVCHTNYVSSYASIFLQRSQNASIHFQDISITQITL